MQPLALRDPAGPTAVLRRSVAGVLPGLALAAVVGATLATLRERLDPVPVPLLAVVLGVAFGRTRPAGTRLRGGLGFASRQVLRTGIVILGFRLSISEVRELGAAVMPVVAAVAISFVGIRLLGRLLGLTTSQSLLVATGYSICGVSAIAAVEPLAGASDEEVAYSVALVTLCGTLSIAIFPALGSWFGLDAGGFGVWVGASVHDVGQVVATATTRGDVALSTAVVVKLTRVALLAPLVALLALQARRRDGSAHQVSRLRHVIPPFVVLFLVAVLVRSGVPAPAAWWSTAQDIEQVLLITALFAIGCHVDLRRLRRLGGRPLVLGLAGWVLVAAVGLLASVVANVGTVAVP